jgi:uncharacterized protein involved in exopolysaccharide biosynthesis
LSDIHLPSAPDPHEAGKQPEVRLELTRAGVEQVLSLYSQEQGSRRAESAFTIRFEDLQQAIRERRQMLVVGLAAGIAVGVLILLASTTLYSTTAQVVLERRDVSGRMTAENAGTGGSAFIATQAEVMASRSVIERAVASIPRAEHLDEDDDASLDALDSVVATPITGTQVIALGYLGPDANYGVRLLEAIVASYRTVIVDLEQQRRKQELDAKQIEIDLLEKEALEIEGQIEALRVAHGVLGSGEDAAETQAQILRDYAQQIANVRNERIALENRLATGGKRLAILDPAMQELQSRLWEAEAELARVQLTLMPKHPAVETAQQEVDVLRKQLSANSSATPAALRRDIDATVGLEKQLNLAHARERERMGAIEAYRREESLLVSELEQIREMADARRNELVDQRLQTRLAEAGEVGVTARIIEAPNLPESATWPRPRLILPATALLGLLCGLAAAVISLRRSREDWAPPVAASTTGIQIR